MLFACIVISLQYRNDTIAVAGGTSPTLGRSIVTAIGQTPNKPVILTRRFADAPSTKYGAEVRQVDYEDQASLIAALKDVHTVISVIKVPGLKWATHQINLLNAAKAAGVKCFAPSEVENGPFAEWKVDILGFKPGVWKACEESGLECARFCGGMFMNYLALGKDFGGETRLRQEATQGLDDVPIVWDIGAGMAKVPIKDDGTTPRITLTDIHDIGRFVAAACGLPNGQWRPNMEVAGDTLRVDDVADIIKSVTGRELKRIPIDRIMLQHTVDGIEGIGKSRDEMVEKMVAQIELMMLRDVDGMTVMRPIVNRLCPSVQPCSVREYVSNYLN